MDMFAISNIGEVRMYFNPPLRLKDGPAWDEGLYATASIDPYPIPGGAIWGAEGPVWAYCRCFGGIGRLSVMSGQQFEGTVWPMRDPPPSRREDDPESPGTCDGGPCEGGPPGGSGTGGTTGYESTVSSPESAPPGNHWVCIVTDWYENGVYRDTEINYCFLEADQ